MDFEFSEEQATIRELAREILETEATIDRVKEVEAGHDWIDEILWSKLAEANLLGIAIPEEHGGMGMGFAELCVLLEEIGRVVAPLPAFSSLVLGGLALAEFGSDAQRARWLPGIAGGKALITAALEDVGSAEVASPETRARADGDGFRLEGAKRHVPGARRVDRILVPTALESGRVAIFLVDPSADGVWLGERRTSTGEPLFDVELAGVRVEADAMLGGSEADGAEVAGWILDRALAATAATQVGVSDKAIQITAAYTREREQFDVPIGSFQAVQHRMADSFIDLEAMRWTAWRAVWSLDAGSPAARESRVAKFWAAEGGARIAGACLHLHGGLGSDVDYPIHRYFLWARQNGTMFGGGNQQAAEIGARLVGAAG